MSVVVRIPTPLRRMTNGQDKVEVQSGNLGAMVDELEGAYPGFKDRLLDEVWFCGSAGPFWPARRTALLRQPERGGCATDQHRRPRSASCRLNRGSLL